MIKGVLLDFNGTLFFDSHFHELAWKEISKQLRGYPMSDEEIKRNVHGKNNEKIINYLTDNQLEPKENKAVSLEKEAMYRQMCINDEKKFVLAPGVEEFLNYLVEKKLPFTIASASIKENIDFFVSSFKLDKWLDPNLIVYDDGNYATKVEMFNEAAKRLDVDIKECLVVEDSISGIEFAHQCDVAKIIAINSDKDKEKYQEFDYLTDILDDFTTFPYDIFEMEH